VCGPAQDGATFLASVLNEAVAGQRVTLREDPASAKDYVDLEDAMRMIEAIASRGRQRIYNVASGNNTSHRTLAQLLERRLGSVVEFAPAAPRRTFARIDISRTQQEFGFVPTPFSDTLDGMIARLNTGAKPRIQ
jgi:nucleoside-diphosphate-sugar epimerase